LVQRLNLARGEINLAADTTIVEKINEEYAEEEQAEIDKGSFYLEERSNKNLEQEDIGDSPEEKDLHQPAKKSKWDVFVEESSCNQLY